MTGEDTADILECLLAGGEQMMAKMKGEMETNQEEMTKKG
jgi:hypothetical protein